jgi:predicted Rossmann fold nucleotide-binding protein DprA/Smf involved in DNA uptake
MLTCVDDIFTDLPYLSDAPKQQTLGIAEPDGKIFPQRGPEISCPIERKIYEVLTNEKSATLDAIITISELPSKRVINSLQMLEIRGITARRYDGLFEVKKTMVV